MKQISKIYWLIPFLIFISQLYFTNHSFSQIRYEELAESIRNVYWLQNRTIYDGVSSNVGWYGTLLFIYNIFGFSLNSAKYFRLILSLVSLFCLAAFLRKYLDQKTSVVSLITIGMSPTLLYFNTLQTSFGLDLQYLPICLYLISSLNFRKHLLSRIQEILLCFISMVAWMSYPPFIYYLPMLGIYYLYQLRKASISKIVSVSHILMALLAFLLPFITVLVYLKDPRILLYDTKLNSGIFRGAGSLYLNLDNFIKNIVGFLADLFNKGSSYHFELAKGDFSDFYPILTFIILLILGLVLTIHVKNLRFVFTLIWTTAFISIMGNLAFDPSGHPGIRRNTGLLAVTYALFTVVYYYSTKKVDVGPLKNTLIILLLILPLHHFLVYPINLSHIKDSSLYKSGLWFTVSENPQRSIELFINQIQKEDLKLSCKDEKGELIYCRYPEIYSAVAGSCFWNHLDCKQILGFDSKTKNFLPLEIPLWESYYFEH